MTTKKLVIIAGYHAINEHVEPFCIIGTSLKSLDSQISKIDFDSSSICYTFAGDINKYRIAGYTRQPLDLKMDIDNAVVAFKNQSKFKYD